MKPRLHHHRLACLAIDLLCALFLAACLHHQATRTARGQPEPASEEIKKVVDGISLIQGLPPKSGERPTDEHAIAIVALGKRAAPYLADKLTDTALSRVVYGFPYTIGDLALALLDEIYQPQGWPFPDDRVKIPEKYGDYRDYVEFVSSPGSRERLKESWQEFIKSH